MVRHYANTKGFSLSAHGILTVPHIQNRMKKLKRSSSYGTTAQEGDNEEPLDAYMSQEPLLVPYQTSPKSKQPITEKDVFDLLGMPWIPPHLRNA